jgi:hypothetical protein
MQLDFTDWEMNRSHWAVKDVDLFPVLLEAGVLDAEVVYAQPPDSKIATIGLGQTPSEIEARPTVFRNRAPVDTVASDVLQKFDADGVHTAIFASGGPCRASSCGIMAILGRTIQTNPP